MVHAYRSVENKGIATHKTGVGTKIPSGCNQTSVEMYDGLTYYHYECISQVRKANDSVTLFEIKNKSERNRLYGAIVSGYSRYEGSFEYTTTALEWIDITMSYGNLMTHLCRRENVKFRNTIIATYDICMPNAYCYENDSCIPRYYSWAQQALIIFGNRH